MKEGFKISQYGLTADSSFPEPFKIVVFNLKGINEVMNVGFREEVKIDDKEENTVAAWHIKPHQKYK